MPGPRGSGAEIFTVLKNRTDVNGSQPMIRKLALRRGILALLVPWVAQASTPEQLLDELGKSPGINVTQVNETSYLFVLQPTEDSSAAPHCDALTTDACEVRINVYKCDCPKNSGNCIHCRQCQNDIFQRAGMLYSCPVSNGIPSGMRQGSL